MDTPVGRTGSGRPTVYVFSGYDTFGEAPGNVLLAFTIDGR